MAGIEEILESLGKFGSKAKELGTKYGKKGGTALEGMGKRVGEFFEHGYPSRVLDRLTEAPAARAEAGVIRKGVGRVNSAVGNLGKRMGTGMAKGVGRGLTNAGNSKALVGATLLGGAALGMAHTAGPALHDAAMETAFGDPNADTAFTGRRFNGRFLAGSMMGGLGGSAMRLSSPKDYLYQNPLPSTRVMAGGAAFAAAPLGAAIGAMGGAGLGYALGGKGGKIAGGLIGGIAGAGAGLATPFMAAKKYMNHNKQFFAESPYGYNSSSSTASALNASGDIVLGMHNSRRGY